MGYFVNYPPFTWTGAPLLTMTSYGYLWPRHQNRVNAGFVDGHVRSGGVKKQQQVGGALALAVPLESHE